MVAVTKGLWQFSARHPDWTEDEGGEDGWDPDVGWWALAAPEGIVLIDPLVEAWADLDMLIEAHGGCAGVLRTCHWHQRSIPAAAARYRAPVWSGRSDDGATLAPGDHPVEDGDRLPGGAHVARMARTDEIALWLEPLSALVFGDAMVRDGDGVLRVCPESWTQPSGGRPELLARLRELQRHRPRHVLVSHGPLVAGDGVAALNQALA